MATEKHPSCTATLQIDNTWVRVAQWRIQTGKVTGHDTHGHDYVVVQTAGGTPKIS